MMVVLVVVQYGKNDEAQACQNDEWAEFYTDKKNEMAHKTRIMFDLQSDWLLKSSGFLGFQFKIM